MRSSELEFDLCVGAGEAKTRRTFGSNLCNKIRERNQGLNFQSQVLIFTIRRRHPDTPTELSLKTHRYKLCGETWMMPREGLIHAASYV